MDGVLCTEYDGNNNGGDDDECQAMKSQFVNVRNVFIVYSPSCILSQYFPAPKSETHSR